MVARRALVRIDGDTRQLPPEDALVGATRVNELDGDVTLSGTSGVNVDLVEIGDAKTLELSLDIKTVNGTSLIGSGDVTVSGGLTNFTESITTAAPNATVPVVALAAIGAAANIDAVIAPKGSGAFACAVADNTAIGGNKRGGHAVDFQTSRAIATQVASGTYAFTAGIQCTASGVAATAIGVGCTATQAASLAFGSSTTASGAAAFAIGGTTIASGSYSFAGGATCTASGNFSFSIGQSCVADSIASIATGVGAITRGMYGAQARQVYLDTAGSQQDRLFRLVRTTTTNTAVPLTADGTTTATSSNTLNMVANSTYAVKGILTARDVSGISASWDVTALAKMGATASTIALVGTPTLVSLFKDTGAALWLPTVTVNTTLGTININGAGSTTSTKWSFSGISVETVY